jgi:hypothetical protein
LNFRNPSAGLSTAAIELGLLFLRRDAKLTKFQFRYLERRNRISNSSVISTQGPVVSVTSYGERLRSVHLTLESIAAGSLLPSRLILWVDTEEAYMNPSAGLKRLVDRGLEIRHCDNFGPHTKYYPYLLSTEKFEKPLVTADDDMLYSRWWLEGLAQSRLQSPETIHCYRAHKIKFGNGKLAPYTSWSACRSTLPSFLHFATGVSGCIYPASFLEQLRVAGAEFMRLCPKADDIWLHFNSVRSGIKTQQVLNRSLRFPSIPGTQESGLFHTNYIGGQNDMQIEATYSHHELDMLANSVSGQGDSELAR